MTTDLVEAKRERNSNGSKVENPENVTVNSAIVDSIGTNSHRDRKAGKRALGSAAVSSVKKLKTKVDEA